MSFPRHGGEFRLNFGLGEMHSISNFARNFAQRKNAQHSKFRNEFRETLALPNTGRHRAVKPPPPPPPTLRPWSPLLLPPFQPPSQPQRPLKPPHDACTQGTREGQKRCTNGRTAGQNGRNGRRRAARAGVVVLAAAGPGKAACRHAAAAAGRVRGRTYLHAKCMVEAQKSYEGQTDDPEAAGRARDGRSRPAGQWSGLGAERPRE
jgi:hypothetical protein